MSQTSRTNKSQRLQIAVLEIHNKTFPVYDGVNTIGRNKEAIVNVKHLNISQNHAIIVTINGNHFISDLKSSNGTFLGNHKVEPFSLSELKNNTSIRLGDLQGKYISQGPFPNNDQNHTQDDTQSFYGSNTQIMDNLKINYVDDEIDIHEAPTQEISWATFKIPKRAKHASLTTAEKTSSKNLPRNIEFEEDIHNCATQVICHPGFKKDQSNTLQQSGDNELETAGPDGDSKSCSNENNLPQSLVTEDIHEAPTQILPLLSNTSDVKNIQELEFFGTYNDEELPVLENNDNYVEVHQIPEVDRILDIHEAVTQVIDICKKSKSPVPDSNLEDDEATDCEDNVDAINLKINSEDLKDKHSLNNSQDEVTDCEDNTQDNQVKPLKGENKNSFLASDDDSNESIEFFKLDRSINKDSKESFNKSDVAGNQISFEVTKENKDDNLCKIFSGQACSNDSTEISYDEPVQFKKKKVRHLASDSETDEEEIRVKRNKKSSMIISTEDICDKESDGKLNLKDDNKKKSNFKDSYVINDTDSETEIECVGKGNLEASIDVTRDQSNLDFNDTDCIPATQEATREIKSMIRIPNNDNDNLNESSEETFKLGLTELMTNSSQATNNNPSAQDPCCSKNLKNTTNPTISGASIKDNAKVDIIQSDDTDKTDIYEAPMQYMKNTEMDSTDNKTLMDDQSTLDVDLAPTEKVDISKMGIDKTCSDYLQDTDVYDVPTQRFDHKNKNRNGSNRQIDTIDDDIYFASTQKVSHEIPENVYDAPTQEINIEHQTNKKRELDTTSEDTYLAPTQKVFHKKSYTEHNNSREESMDELYLQSTQQIDDIFNQPPQKVNTTSNLEVEYNIDEIGRKKPNPACGTSDHASLQSKKKFSFKKKAPNLDGSITSLLVHHPQQTHEQITVNRETRSSIELELVQDINPSPERCNTPSNPLSLILENNCKSDENEGNEQAIIHELPVGTKIDGVTNSEEEIPDKSNSGSGKTEIIQCKNKTKLNDKEICNAPDNMKGERINTCSADTSRQNQTNENSDVLAKSRRSRRPSASEVSSNKTSLDPSKLEFQTENTEKKENIKNKLNIKPVGRRAPRLRSSTDTKTNVTHFDIDEKKVEVSPDHSVTNLNTTHNEVNQSVAFLESKITKTRKTRNSEKIQVKVPKSRKSMSISEINEASQTLDNNNTRSKSDQKSNTDIEVPGTLRSKSNRTTNRRGQPKNIQSEDGEIQANKPLKSDQHSTIINDRPKRNNLKLEAVNGQEINSITNRSLENTIISSASTSKFVSPSASKTRQVGKRKQLTDVKSDSSDTSVQSIDTNLTTPKKPKLQPSRQVGKRKQLSDAKSDKSDSSSQSVNSTPKKQRLEPSEVLLNTRERELRKQKPKVVFTMLESPQMESMIKRLGGGVIDSIDACSVLLTEHVKRSQKLLSAVGLGKPICSPKWITDSKKAHEFLDPWDYILTDPEAEKKWEFSLRESLNRSRTEKLLISYHFQIMVTNAVDVLKGAIESCGGKCISKIPSKPLENTFIISIPENQSKYRRIMKQHPNVKVIEPEAIFDGVLRQELRFSKHYLT